MKNTFMLLGLLGLSGTLFFSSNLLAMNKQEKLEAKRLLEIETNELLERDSQKNGPLNQEKEAFFSDNYMCKNLFIFPKETRSYHDAYESLLSKFMEIKQAELAILEGLPEIWKQGSEVGRAWIEIHSALWLVKLQPFLWDNKNYCFICTVPKEQPTVPEQKYAYDFFNKPEGQLFSKQDMDNLESYRQGTDTHHKIVVEILVKAKAFWDQGKAFEKKYQELLKEIERIRDLTKALPTIKTEQTNASYCLLGLQRLCGLAVVFLNTPYSKKDLETQDKALTLIPQYQHDISLMKLELVRLEQRKSTLEKKPEQTESAKKAKKKKKKQAKKEKRKKAWQEFLKTYTLSAFFVWNPKSEPSTKDYKKVLEAALDALREKQRVFEALALVRLSEKCSRDAEKLGIIVKDQKYPLFVCKNTNDPDERALCNYLTYGTPTPEKVAKHLLEKLAIPGTQDFCLHGDEWQKWTQKSKNQDTPERIKNLAGLLLDLNMLSDGLRRDNPFWKQKETIESVAKKLEQQQFSLAGHEKYTKDFALARKFLETQNVPDLVPNQQPVLDALENELKRLV